MEHTISGKENSIAYNDKTITNDVKDPLGEQISKLHSTFSSYFTNQVSLDLENHDLLLQDLDNILKEFSKIPYYHQDKRLMQLWFLYAKLSWNTKDIIHDMLQHDICTMHSSLYIQLSQYYEYQEKSVERAWNIIQKGILCNAEPRSQLIQFSESFQRRHPSYKTTGSQELVGYNRSVIFDDQHGMEQSFEEFRCKIYQKKAIINSKGIVSEPFVNATQDVMLCQVIGMIDSDLKLGGGDDDGGGGDIDNENKDGSNINEEMITGLYEKYPSIFQSCRLKDHHFMIKQSMSKYSTLLECLEKWSSTTNRRKSCRPSLAPKLSSMAPPFNLGIHDEDMFTIRYVQRLPNLSTIEGSLVSLAQEWKATFDSDDVEPKCFALFASRHQSFNSALYQGLLSLMILGDGNDNGRSFWIPCKHLLVYDNDNGENESERTDSSGPCTTYTLYPYKSPFTLATICGSLNERLDELIGLYFVGQLLKIVRILQVNHIAHNDIKLDHILFVQEEHPGKEDDFYLCLGYFDHASCLKSHNSSAVYLEDLHQQWMAPFISSTSSIAQEQIPMLKDLFDLAFLIYQLIYNGGEMEIYQEEEPSEYIWHVKLPDQSSLWNSILLTLLNPTTLDVQNFIDPLIEMVQEALKKQKSNAMPSLLTRMKRLSVQLYQTEG